jgi:hypothetical protein
VSLLRRGSPAPATDEDTTDEDDDDEVTTVDVKSHAVPEASSEIGRAHV